MTSINELITLCDNDSKLLGAIQELSQLRENPLLQLKPCWKYVKKNNYADQILHIQEEITEALEEQNYEKFLLECFDILQSAVTLMYVLQTKYGVNLTALFADGHEKNNKRDYYEVAE